MIKTVAEIGYELGTNFMGKVREGSFGVCPEIQF
jgi:hypothetical protein